MRDRGVRLKLNPIASTLKGRRVVLIDDSIVRGSTTRQLVQLVRECGAAEVHLRISSPPYRWPCYYGMDTSDRSTLIAAQMAVERSVNTSGADSLGYLSLTGLRSATGVGERWLLQRLPFRRVPDRCQWCGRKELSREGRSTQSRRADDRVIGGLGSTSKAPIGMWLRSPRS